MPLRRKESPQNRMIVERRVGGAESRLKVRSIPDPETAGQFIGSVIWMQGGYIVRRRRITQFRRCSLQDLCWDLLESSADQCVYNPLLTTLYYKPVIFYASSGCVVAFDDRSKTSS